MLGSEDPILYIQQMSRTSNLKFVNGKRSRQMLMIAEVGDKNEHAFTTAIIIQIGTMVRISGNGTASEVSSTIEDFYKMSFMENSIATNRRITRE